MPMPGRRSTGLPAPRLMAVKLASASTMASSWPISASTLSRSGVSSGSMFLSMAASSGKAFSGQVGGRHSARHHSHGVAHADLLGVDHGGALAQAGDVDAVGNLEHMGHVVADEDDGQALVAHAADQLQHHVALLHAEGGSGLVHDDHMARKRCRARHSHALPSSPGRRSSRPRNRFSAMVMAGATARSWYTVSMPARRASMGLLNWMRWPSSRISPSSGTVAPDSALMRLDLPAPLSPITARISPARSSKSAPSSAVTWP